MSIGVGHGLAVNNEVAAPHVKRTLTLFSLYPLVGCLYWFLHGFCVNPVGFIQIGRDLLSVVVLFLRPGQHREDGGRSR